MNRQVVSIETLKSYFETGKKPTQAQFSNLIDAFYHKNEGIPQDKIDGLADTLSNKAETTVVDAKANADASGLSEENKVAWKEALGVGEVPDNMAKIDTESEQGNVHTKEQIEELLENSGKNIGNSDLKVPEGTERTLDLTNAKMVFKGLENKKGDASFNRRLKANERGELVYTDDADINVYFPENVNVNVHYNSPNIVQNNIPEGVETIKNFVKNINNVSFTKLSADDFQVNIDESLKNNFSNIGTGIRYLSQVNVPDSQYRTGHDQQILGGTSIVSLKSFSTRKKWCLKVPVNNAITIWNSYNGHNKIGLVRNLPDDIGLSFIAGVKVEYINNTCSQMKLILDERQYTRTPNGIFDHNIYAIFYCDGQGLIYASYLNNTGQYLTEIIGVGDAEEVRLAGTIHYTFRHYAQFLEFGKNTEYYIEE